MQIAQNISINQALRENLITMIHCVFNKIPLLICGKPGCSKTLSIQILVENFKGKESVDPYFKTLDKIY